MSFLAARKVGWDTETTSPEPTEARIVTAALVVRGGGLPDRTFTWLINPGVPIPDEAADIHGITDAIAQADGQEPKTALEDIASKLALGLLAGIPTIAFNTAFDWTVLNCDLARHGLRSMAERLGDLTAPPLVDPHVVDKQVDKYVKGSGMRKLKPTCERYKVALEDWHTAEADALAALLIAEAQFELYPLLADYRPAQLFAAQKAWRAEQQAGLQEYFRRKDPAAVVEGAWPLIPHQGGEQA